MQSTDALEEEVHGRDVADEQIEVNVEGLLEHLGTDDDDAMRTGLVRASKTPDEVGLPTGTLWCDEPGMNEDDLAVETLPEYVEGLLGSCNGVADDPDAAALGRLLLEPLA